MQQEPKLTEKETAARNKAIWLAGEVNACQLPPTPFKLNHCTSVNNVRQFIDVSEAVLLTALPLTHNWKAAYNRLLELKLYLQKSSHDT